MADQKVQFIISAKNLAEKVFKDAQSNLKKFGTQAKKSAKIAGVAFAGFTALAVRNTVLFEKAMSDVNTLFDDNGESVKKLSDGIKNMMKEIPVSADELGAGAYQVVSAGISDTAEALMVLERASKLSVAGLSTVEEAVNLSTSAINAFGLTGKKAAKAFDILQLTVKSGKTNVAELAQSFGLVAGIAKAACVEFEELQAATAALTTTGQKASVAQTQLKTAILGITAPTSAMSSALRNLGFASGELIIKEKGLVGAFELLKKEANGSTEEMKKMFGSSEALGAVISLTGEQGEAFTNTLNQMTNAGGELDIAFAKQNKTLSASIQRMKNLSNLISLELISTVFPNLSEQLNNITADTSKMIEATHALGIVLRSIITVAGMVVQGFYNIGQVIGTLIFDFNSFNENVNLAMQGITISVQQAFLKIKNSVISILTTIKNSFFSTMESIKESIFSSLDAIGEAWDTTWNNAKESFFGVWEDIKNGLTNSLNFIIQKINVALGALSNISILGKQITGNLRISEVGFANGGVAQGGVTGFANGGVVNKPTRALIGEGSMNEAVVPLPNGRSIPVEMGGGKLQPNIIININARGSILSQNDLVDFISDSLARRLQLL